MGMRKTFPHFIVFLKHFNRCILHRLEYFINVHYCYTADFPASLFNTLQISKLLDCDQQFYSR